MSELEQKARLAAEKIVPQSDTRECPWCLAHPHRDPCCFQCGSARVEKRDRNNMVDEVAAVIASTFASTAIGDAEGVGSTRFLVRDDAENFIKRYLHSAQWEGERLIVSFEREALIEALVDPAVPDGRVAASDIWDEVIAIAKQNCYWGGYRNDQVISALEAARAKSIAEGETK